jgi:hypothetical protein
MLSIWGIIFFLLGLQVVSTIYLIIPKPNFLNKPLLRGLNLINPGLYVLLLIYVYSMYNSYIGFTEYFPFTTIQEARTPDKLSLILSKHYRYQRNFYISAFAFTILM